MSITGPNMVPPSHENQAPLPDPEQPLGAHVPNSPTPTTPPTARPIARELGAKHGLDRSAIATVLWVLAPKALASLLVMYLLAPAWLLFWLVAGGLAFTSRFEPMVARLMGLRQPTAWEKRLLETVWGRVTARAGIASNSYTLWVQDSSEINASASLGTTIAITRGALSQLSPEELEAVLAHELGHHQLGHSTVAFLLYFYGLPVDLVMRFLGRVLWSTILSSGPGSVVFCLFAVTAMMVFPLTAVLLMSGPLSRYHSRRSEFAADEFAAKLGYGPQLAAVFQNWIDRGWEDHTTGWPARIMSTHPPLGERVLRLENLDSTPKG
ncbi:M48 family metalloprotease [Saccharomonospora viridis]|jgi:Zn-dependent protease with chaperone function|uniref:Peptidase M48 domain-containing protein n=1 Tax=Saccharomonospora viridis TaxID=1852 RepID=A0A837D8L3_9PSEU|nr:M48 family metalloprotease [Saccharomonospora viridis]KHF43188.1 hypothetical protein MINT15_33900 [Saccharomonospora viridis]SFO83186.1 STE24 endopeptidase [Saccharomonospora viridis]